MSWYRPLLPISNYTACTQWISRLSPDSAAWCPVRMGYYQWPNTNAKCCAQCWYKFIYQHRFVEPFVDYSAPGGGLQIICLSKLFMQLYICFSAMFSSEKVTIVLAVCKMLPPGVLIGSFSRCIWRNLFKGDIWKMNIERCSYCFHLVPLTLK